MTSITNQLHRFHFSFLLMFLSWRKSIFGRFLISLFRIYLTFIQSFKALENMTWVSKSSLRMIHFKDKWVSCHVLNLKIKLSHVSSRYYYWTFSKSKTSDKLVADLEPVPYSMKLWSCYTSKLSTTKCSNIQIYTDISTIRNFH